MRLFAAAALAAIALLSSASADQILGPGRIDTQSRVLLPGGPTLGTFSGGRYIAKPDAIEIQGTGSKGNLSGTSAIPDAAAPANSLARLFADRATLDSPEFRNKIMAPALTPSSGADATSAVNRLSLQSFVDCPSTSQEVTKTSFCANYLSPNGKTFMYNFGLTSDATSPVGDKVALYAAFRGMAGGAGGWAANFLTEQKKGSNGSHGVEIDINNFDCDVGGPVSASKCEHEKSSIGLLITGLSRDAQGVGGAARAAIVITTPQESLWHHGLSFEGPAIIDSELFTNSSSDRVLDIRGTHLFGMDLGSATFTGSAISLGYGKANHHIAWRGGAGVVFNIATDTNLRALVFSSGSGGNTLFKTDGSWTMPRSLTVGQNLTVTGVAIAQAGMSVGGGNLNVVGAANNIGLGGAGAGSSPSINAFGSDANVSLNLQSAGTGLVNVVGNGFAINGTSVVDGGRRATFTNITSSGGVRAANLPTSGTAKGTVCVTAAGDLYVKTTSGACL
ncbi:hypothetical protein [Methylorubrum thiocyanatum]|uniref:hypothetical protein n=1 Tax=Methylorubrum thiocyanatum TaxID=47958 RepID=UPI0035C8655B